MRAGSKQLIREINQAIVLNAIRTHGPLSRTDIAGIAKISLAIISGITAELIEASFVYERENGASTSGRPPVLLALNTQAGDAGDDIVSLRIHGRSGPPRACQGDGVAVYGK